MNGKRVRPPASIGPGFVRFRSLDDSQRDAGCLRDENQGETAKQGRWRACFLCRRPVLFAGGRELDDDKRAMGSVS